jgi:hypothetical protein
MGSFDADQAVEPLYFNFRAYGPKGTIPEPTHAQTVAYFAKAQIIQTDRVKRLTAIVSDTDLSAEERQERIDKTNEDCDQATIESVSVLCSGTPSAEQILALPHRLQVEFLNWVRTELRNPTKPAGATTASRAALNGAGSTTSPSDS